MSNMRSFWWLALAFTLFWIWIQWEAFVAQKKAANVETAQVQTQEGAPSSQLDAIPQAPQASAKQSDLPQVMPSHGPVIQVKTDEYDLDISLEGGNLVRLALLQYPVTGDDPTNPFVLLDTGRSLFFTAQTGLAAVGEVSAPTHKARFVSPASAYTMAADAQELRVPLVWQDQGVEVTKTYVFTRGSYKVGVEYAIRNQSAAPYVVSPYAQIIRNKFDNTGNNQFIYTFTGGVAYTQEEKYRKIALGDMSTTPYKADTLGGWAGMIQHYFAVVALGDPTQTNHLFSGVVDQVGYKMGIMQPSVEVPVGGQIQVRQDLWVGPKLQHQMYATAEGLELTVDYGILTLIAEPIFWLLEKIHALVGNWGWSIILLTILIKLLFYKLSATSYRSMAHMRDIGPKLKQLKERYGDDKVTFQKKMMEMYREEKINPLGGCLPILVQIPVFIALYWVLMESVELRQAPWILWINDMSVMDPYYILPILMGLSMFVQQMLNPTPMDEMQAKIMKWLPLVFTFFFLWFPAGLVIYWVTNNILSIAQQWWIIKTIEKEKAEKHALKGQSQHKPSK